MDKRNAYRHRPKKDIVVDNFMPSGNQTDLSRPIEELELSEATYTALKAGKINTLSDLARRRVVQMYKIQNVGKKNCYEISKKLAKYNLAFRPEEVVGEAEQSADNVNGYNANKKPTIVERDNQKASQAVGNVNVRDGNVGGGRVDRQQRQFNNRNDNRNATDSNNRNDNRNATDTNNRNDNRNATDTNNRNDNRNATDVNNRNDNRNATDVNNRNDNRFGNQRKYDPNSKGYNGGGQGQNVQGRGAQNGQGQYVQSRVNVQDNRGSNQRGNNNASRNNQQFGQRLVGHTQDERNAFYNANRGLNDSLTRQYAGLSMSEILMGKRERPIAQPLPREQLTPESIVKFCRQGKWGYKDWKGNVLIQPTFDEAYSFYEGMACVERAGKLGFINAKGEVVIDFVYDTATSFSEGFASVTKDEKTGYIDKDGKQVIDFVYEIATPFHDGRAVVFVDGRWGVLGADFKVMWR